MIRRATVQDYEGICGAFDDLDDFHIAARPDVLGPREAHGRPRERVEQALADPDAAIFVAEEGGEVIGFAWVLARDVMMPLFRPRRVAVVDALGVRAGRRGRGLGRALMAAAEEWAREAGAVAVEVGVFDFDGSAVGFYEQLGYETLMRRMHKRVT